MPHRIYHGNKLASIIFTEEEKVFILEQRKKGVTFKKICQELGVHRKILYEFCKRDLNITRQNNQIIPRALAKHFKDLEHMARFSKFIKADLKQKLKCSKHAANVLYDTVLTIRIGQTMMKKDIPDKIDAMFPMQYCIDQRGRLMKTNASKDPYVYPLSAY